jgi:ribonuclease HI
MDITHYFNTNTNKETKTNINNSKLDKCNSKLNKDNSNSNLYPNEIYIDKSKLYEVYTDGSAFNNGSKTKLQKGGIGIYFGENENNISEKLYGKITNNIAELKACIKAITIIISKLEFDNKSKIYIYSDSKYVIDSITKWCYSWEKNNWHRYNNKKKKQEPIKNKDLIVELFNYYKKYNIKIIHVKAHGTEPLDKKSIEYKHYYGNKIADKLAVCASNL